MKLLLIKIAIIPIRLYQLVISPLLGNNCRYTPTCSEYAIEAIKKRGVFYGGVLVIKRLCRCHPWAESRYDPVPVKNKEKS